MLVEPNQRPEDPPRLFQRFLQFLVGLLVVWQLLFLVIGNAILFPWRWAPDPVHKTMDDWVGLTGQVQNWQLFAPQVASRALFIGVEIVPDDLDQRIVTRPILARNPLVKIPPFSPPGSNDRLFHFEKELAWLYVAWNPVEVAQRPMEWQKYLTDNVRGHWQAYQAYLRWQLAQNAHTVGPEALAHNAYLYIIAFQPSTVSQAPDPTKATLFPLVRWRQTVQPPPGCLPLEIYTNGWEYLRESDNSQP